MLALTEPPTAFFATNNRTAVGAASVLADRVDIGLVGFDDFELAESLRRAVTVVAYDAADLAGQAVDLLFARLAGFDARPVRRIVPTRLVVRAT